MHKSINNKFVRQVLTALLSYYLCSRTGLRIGGAMPATGLDPLKIVGITTLDVVRANKSLDLHFNMTPPASNEGAYLSPS